MYYSPMLSFLRIICFVIWTLICSPIQFFFRYSYKYFFVILKIYFKGLLFIFGIKIKTFGIPEKKLGELNMEIWIKDQIDPETEPFIMSLDED